MFEVSQQTRRQGKLPGGPVTEKKELDIFHSLDPSNCSITILPIMGHGCFRGPRVGGEQNPRRATHLLARPPTRPPAQHLKSADTPGKNVSGLVFGWAGPDPWHGASYGWETSQQTLPPTPSQKIHLPPLLHGRTMQMLKLCHPAHLKYKNSTATYLQKTEKRIGISHLRKRKSESYMKMNLTLDTMDR